MFQGVGGCRGFLNFSAGFLSDKPQQDSYLITWFSLAICFKEIVLRIRDSNE